MKHYFYSLGVALMASPILIYQGLIIPFKALVGLFDYRDFDEEVHKQKED